MIFKPADPTEPETEVGALMSTTHRDKVPGYVASGLAGGATLVCGGIPVSVPSCANGKFGAPTLFSCPRRSRAAGSRCVLHARHGQRPAECAHLMLADKLADIIRGKSLLPRSAAPFFVQPDHQTTQR